MADLNEKTDPGHRDSDVTATNNEDPTQHIEKPRKKSFVDVDESQLSAAFENPLANIPKAQLLAEVEQFCKDNNLIDHLSDFQKGALVAQNPDKAQSLTELTDEERLVLEREHTHRWSQPFTLYWLVVMCSMAAAVCTPS